jgi:hypothetical protein
MTPFVEERHAGDPLSTEPPMSLASCTNCCFNGLQYGTIGLSLGYCVEKQVVLRQADETTCARHFRKDLTALSAEKNNVAHQRQFPTDAVVSLRTAAPVEQDPSFIEPQATPLRADPVGGPVTEYGLDASKIHALASLRSTPGVRAELAWTSLGRGYVRRCAYRGGNWTSGLHLLWWMKERLATPPALQPADLRLQSRASLSRQFSLATWSITMLRLTLIGDIAQQAAATEDPVGALRDLPEEAAMAASTSERKLQGWVHKHAAPRLEAALPWSRYKALHSDLRAS